MNQILKKAFYFLGTFIAISILSISVQAVTLLEEDWDQGKINEDRWNHSGIVKVKEIAEGDHALLVEDTDIHHWESTIMTHEAFARSGNLRVTYKMWGAGMNISREMDGLVPTHGSCLYGPWHFSHYDLASYFTLEAALAQSSDFYCFDENGNYRVRRMPDTDEFVQAFSRADSKENSLTIRVTLGNDNGALFEWKFEDEWHVSMDTRGTKREKPRTSPWGFYRDYVSSNPTAKIGFVSVQYKACVDDIVVENDISEEEYQAILNSLPAMPEKIVRSEAVPWSREEFNDSPGKIQFAVTTDLTGGYKYPVFEIAVDKLNLLQPDFVITVGDLVEGYANNATVIRNQFEEFDSWVEELEMPFYYVPGNHDVAVEWKENDLMASMWRERYGKEYYHFLYKNVLFLCLNTTDNGDHYTIYKKQQDWALQVLKENQDVRWTFVIMHDPMWEYKWDTGWPTIEQALQDRQYTVFAGHYHRFTKFERKGRNYYILAATGGAYKETIPVEDKGGMDHFAWVTFDEGTPIVGNVALPGVYPDDVVTEAHQREYLDVWSNWMESRAREHGLYKKLEGDLEGYFSDKGQEED